MGIWRVEPFGNDYALEWLGNSIEMPVINAIIGALDISLLDGDDDLGLPRFGIAPKGRNKKAQGNALGKKVHIFC